MVTLTRDLWDEDVRDTPADPRESDWLFSARDEDTERDVQILSPYGDTIEVE